MRFLGAVLRNTMRCPTRTADECFGFLVRFLSAVLFLPDTHIVLIRQILVLLIGAVLRNTMRCPTRTIESGEWRVECGEWSVELSVYIADAAKPVRRRRERS